AGSTGALGRRLAAIAAAVDRANASCATGGTRRARARLIAVGRRVRAAVQAAGATAPDRASDLQLVDALRRATASRLGHHPCPELLEVLAPGAGDDVTGDVYVLVRLADDADPTTLAGALEGPSGAVPLGFE